MIRKVVRRVPKDNLIDFPFADFNKIMDVLSDRPGHFFIANNTENDWVAVCHIDEEVTFISSGETWEKSINELIKALRYAYEYGKDDPHDIKALEEQIAQA